MLKRTRRYIYVVVFFIFSYCMTLLNWPENITAIQVNTRSDEDVPGELYYSLDDEIKFIYFQNNDQGKQRVNIPIDEIKTLRIDPIVSTGDVYYKSISFYIGMFKAFEIDGIDLQSLYIANDDIAIVDTVGSGEVLIDCSGADPYFSLKNDNAFLTDMREDVSHVFQMRSAVIFILTFIILFMFYQLCRRYEKKRRLTSLTEKIAGKIVCYGKNRWVIWSAFLVIVFICSAILFWRYIFGNECFVFSDIGNDSINQTVPNYISRALQIQEYGAVQAWNPNQFLGQDQGTILTISSLVYMFGEKYIGTMLLVLQILEILISAAFFWWYCYYLRFSYMVCSMLAFCYAFCGHMIVRSAWSGYPIEVMCIAILLWALERAISAEKFPVSLILAFVMLIINRGLYTTLIYGLISVVYAFFRIFQEGCIEKSKKPLVVWGKVAAGIVVACILGGGILFPMAHGLTNSARTTIALIEAGEGSSGWFSDIKTLISCYLRTISNDIQGGGRDYSGALNYLEGPVFYCGLICLFLLPFCFKRANIKKNITYVVILCLIFGYNVFLGVRFVANGFAKETFKLSSFWIIVVILYLAGQGLTNLLWHREKCYNKLPVLWGIAILTPLTLLVFAGYQGLHARECFIVFIFAALYMILLYKSRILENNGIKSILFGVVIIEILLVSWPSINNRDTLKKTEYAQHYNKDVYEAVESLKNGNTDLFRVDSPSFELCQSLSQNIMGTRGYVGGTSFPSSLMDFMKSISNSYFERYGYSRYMYGFTQYNEVNTLLGVKYLVYTDSNNWQSEYVPYGYKKIVDDKGVKVYENENFLPLFFCYEQLIGKETYLSLDKVERRKQLLKTMVVEDSCFLENSVDESVIEDVQIDESVQFNDISDLVLQEGETKRIELGNLETSTDLLLSAKIDCTLYDPETGYLNLFIQWGNNLEDSFNYITYSGTEEVELYINAAAGSDIKFTLVSGGDMCTLSEIRVTPYPENWLEDYKNNVEKLRSQAVTVNDYSPTDISLEVEAADDKYLFMSIPFDSHWKAYVDGRETEIIKANFGFMSIPVTKGFHEVNIVYNKQEWGAYIPLGLFAAIIGVYLASRGIKTYYNKKYSKR